MTRHKLSESKIDKKALFFEELEDRCTPTAGLGIAQAIVVGENLPTTAEMAEPWSHEGFRTQQNSEFLVVSVAEEFVPDPSAEFEHNVPQDDPSEEDFEMANWPSMQPKGENFADHEDQAEPSEMPVHPIQKMVRMARVQAAKNDTAPLGEPVQTGDVIMAEVASSTSPGTPYLPGQNEKIEPSHDKIPANGFVPEKIGQVSQQRSTMRQTTVSLAAEEVARWKIVEMDSLAEEVEETIVTKQDFSLSDENIDEFFSGLHDWSPQGPFGEAALAEPSLEAEGSTEDGVFENVAVMPAERNCKLAVGIGLAAAAGTAERLGRNRRNAGQSLWNWYSTWFFTSLGLVPAPVPCCRTEGITDPWTAPTLDDPSNWIRIRKLDSRNW